MSDYYGLLGLLVLIGFPLGWYLQGKAYSEKGLFGFHTCRWLNGCTFGLGKLREGEKNMDGTQAFYCDKHWEELQFLRKRIDEEYYK